jgi:hypothetical protein
MHARVLRFEKRLFLRLNFASYIVELRNSAFVVLTQLDLLAEACLEYDRFTFLLVSCLTSRKHVRK